MSLLFILKLYHIGNVKSISNFRNNISQIRFIENPRRKKTCPKKNKNVGNIIKYSVLSRFL